VIDNCAPEDITLSRGQTIGFLEPEIDTPIPFSEQQLNDVISDISAVTVKKNKKTRTKS